MKVCYYNWVDFDDELNRGGGVTVYQRNIMEADKKSSYFISSGVYYAPPFNKVFYKINERKARIYNSPILAPAHLSYGDVAQVSNDELENCFIKLIKEFGGFDIIHFNNLEGVSAELLAKIKENFPSMKIVLSVHNYYPFCSQVNLWYKEKSNCINYNDGKKCVTCVSPKHSISAVKKAYFLGDFLRGIRIKDNTPIFNMVWSLAYKINSILNLLKLNSNFSNKLEDNKVFDLLEKSNAFKYRREKFIENINKYVDGVITVSERVRELCIKFGVHAGLCKTLYIGTKHASYWMKSESINRQNNDIFTIAYLGYMRRDKGFPFLLESLKKISPNIAKNIKLVVAAKKDEYEFEKLLEVSENFYSLEYYDGYNHNNLDLILKGVSLGIVPPLWEDNLPQVAIEMHCRRIPILTSSTGGAKELHNSSDKFTFISGDSKSFKQKLEALYINGIDREDYFSSSIVPISMDEHLNHLEQYYRDLLGENK